MGRRQMGTIQVGTVTQLLDQWLSDVPPPDKLTKTVYPHFHVRVACMYRRPPRHPEFQLLADLGVGLIDDVLQHRPLRGPVLTFIFPERWMSVAEQRNFMQCLHTHPTAVAGDIRQVDIVTSSPIMLTDFFASSIRIIKFDDDYLYEGAPDVAGKRAS